MKGNKKFLDAVKDDAGQVGSVIVGIVTFVIIMVMGLVIVNGMMNSTNVTTGPMASAGLQVAPNTTNIFNLSWNVPLVLIAATILGYLGYRFV